MGAIVSRGETSFELGDLTARHFFSSRDDQVEQGWKVSEERSADAEPTPSNSRPFLMIKS
jgi:hypothetical protein